MINYNKNDLINETLDRYYETFSHTLDTADFVPEKYNDKINKYIFKNMKKTFKKIDKEDKIYQKSVKKQEKKCKKQEKQNKKKGGFLYGLLHFKAKKNGKETHN